MKEKLYLKVYYREIKTVHTRFKRVHCSDNRKFWMSLIRRPFLEQPESLSGELKRRFRGSKVKKKLDGEEA